MIPLMQTQAEGAVQNGLKGLKKGSEPAVNFAMLLNSAKEEKPSLIPALLMAGLKSDAADTLVAEDDNRQSAQNGLKGLLNALLQEGEEGEDMPLFDTTALNDGEQSDESKLLHPAWNALLLPKSKESIKQLISEAKTALKEQILQVSGEKTAKTLPNSLGALLNIAKEKGIDVTGFSLKNIPQSDFKEQLVQSVQTVLKADAPKTATTQLIAQLQQTLKHEETPVAKKSSTQNDSPLKGLLHTKKTVESAAEVTEASQPLQNVEAKKEKGAQTAVKEVQTVAEKGNEELPQAVAPKSDKESKSRRTLTSEVAVRREGESDSSTSAALTMKSEKAPLVRPTVTDTGVSTTTDEESELDEVANEKSASAKESHHTAATVDKESGMKDKIAEAKTMIRHLASDLADAVKDYKPPFTKLNLKLRPHNLGDVELTLVQRGNNVHINISSNSAALVTLMQNANELRTQLTQVGLSDATMNFNHNGSKEGNGGQNPQQQQQRAAHEYEQYANSRDEEELEVASLELVIPQYI